MKKILIAMLAMSFLGIMLLTVSCTPTKNQPSIFFHKTSKTDYTAFKGLNMEKAEIGLKFEGKDLGLTLPVYIETNRYYLPLSEIVNNLNGSIKINENIAQIELNNLSILLDTKNNLYNKNGKEHKLRKKAILTDNVVYVSAFDLHKMFNLKIDWDDEHKFLSLYWNRDKLEHKQANGSGKPALIRLEDVAPGNMYTAPETFEKLRIVADYLYSENIPFHVAWVPRYISPKYNIDNDPAKQNSMTNADFIYALDYMIERNGIIGLHGYTHQYGNSESIGGVEFYGKGIPGTDQYTQERLNLAIEAAKTLDIPYAFFEVPHYAASPSQFKVIEKNFDVIYEHYPGVYSKIVDQKSGNRTARYIPTPLDYVDGKNDTKNMIAKINNLAKSNVLGSLFYHPYIEFEDINIARDADGYPAYTYSGSSVLHQLAKTFRDKGYKFVTINDVK